MCVEPHAHPHEPGDDPSQPADEPETQSKEDRLAKRILNGLGFCGHYMHFHGGGISGKAPIVCLLAKQPTGELSQQELGMHFDLKPGSLSEILSKLELGGLIERSRNPKDRRQLTIRLTDAGWERPASTKRPAFALESRPLAPSHTTSASSSPKCSRKSV